VKKRSLYDMIPVCILFLTASEDRLILREGKHGAGMEFVDIQHTAFGTRRLVRMHRED
jgi:hypothetical protein